MSILKNQIRERNYLILIFLFTLLFSNLLIAQQKDPNIYQLPKGTSLFDLPIDTILVKLDNATNSMKGETDSQIKADIWAVLRKAKATKDPALMAKTYQVMANWHYLSVTSENKDSIYYHDNEALKYFLQTDDKELIANAYRTVGFDLEFMQRFAEAEEKYFKSLNIAKAINYQKGINSVHASLAGLYSNTKDYESALKYSEMVVEAYEKEGNTHPLIRALLTQNNSYLKIGKPESALKVINKALLLIPKLPENRQKTETLNVRAWRGKVYRSLKRYEDALIDYNFSWIGMKEIYGENMANGWKGNIGSIYYLQKKYALAIPYLKDYVEHHKDKKVYIADELKEHYFWLAESYRETNEPSKAYKYLLEGNEIAINALQQENEALRSELRIKYETEQKDATIASQTDLIAQQKKNQLMSFAIGGLLVLFLGSLLYAYRKNLKKNIQLEELNQSLATINAQLDKRNAENELLLKEIHHRVKNNLEIVSSLLELQSSQIDDPSVQEAIISSQNRVYSMGIIHQKLYQSEQLTSIEMRDYFVNLGENISNAFGSDGKVKIECDMPDLVLDVDTAISVGLIANELLTNAFKYAFDGKEGGKIEINMKTHGPNNENLELKIKDDGVGKKKDSPAKGSGFGTMLIDLLTRQINGTITYNVDNGTDVSLIFSKNQNLA